MTNKENAASFTISAEQLEALAAEVGAALVGYENGAGRHRYGQWTAISGWSPADWNTYFKLAFGAVDSPDDGVVLGDLMFKDTGRHMQQGADHFVTVLDREAEMYLSSAFGPDVTLATIGKTSEGGKVTFAELPEGEMNVIAAQGPWDEAETGPGRPLSLRYSYGSGTAAEMPMYLTLHVREDPESVYGCYVADYTVSPEQP